MKRDHGFLSSNECILEKQDTSLIHRWGLFVLIN